MIDARINAHKANKQVLRDVSAFINNKLPVAVEEGLAILAEEMRRLAPVDSGALRESIHVVKGAVEIGGQVGGKHRHYALFVEFGTVDMPAQPFIRPAVDVSRNRIERAIALRLKP